MKNDMLKEIERIVTNFMPKILKDRINNIRIATVTSWNESAKTVDIIFPSGATLASVKYQQGVTSVSVGASVLLITPDPFSNSNFKAIIF